ncbi:hypothetical protein GCM10008985_04750 [Halococcus dombrowskii]|uniref:Secreted protein n=1 Tax=Halococcus dombrowskii TaxID=179637 RepID=A0AAV3SDI9_HALDO
MKETVPFPCDIGMAASYLPLLLAVVVRPVFFAGENALFVLKSFLFCREVQRPDGMAVGVVCVFEYPHVDTDAPFWIVGFLRRPFVVVDDDGRKPFAGRFLLDVNLFECRIVRNLSVITSGISPIFERCNTV